MEKEGASKEERRKRKERDLYRVSGAWESLDTELSSSFVGKLFDFLGKFTAWKRVDEVKLSLRIINALKGLYGTRKTLLQSGNDDFQLAGDGGDIYRKILDDIRHLRMRYRQVCGQAAYCSMQEEMKKQYGDAAVLKDDDKVVGDGGAGGGSSDVNRRLNAAADANGSGGSGGSIVGSVNEHVVDDRKESDIILTVHKREYLALELLYDPNYQMTDDEDHSESVDISLSSSLRKKNVASQQKRYKDCMQKAFWDSIESEMALTDPCVTRVCRVLKEIEDGLVGVVQGNAIITPRIRSMFEVGMIERRYNAESYLRVEEWRSIFSNIYEIFPMIEYSHRVLYRYESQEKLMKLFSDLEMSSKEAENLKKGFQVELASIIRCGLEDLLKIVNMCRMDCANGRLRAISSVVREGGHDYFRTKFEAKLQDGVLTTQNTKVIFNRAYPKTNDDVSSFFFFFLFMKLAMYFLLICFIVHLFGGLLSLSFFFMLDAGLGWPWHWVRCWIFQREQQKGQWW